MKNKDILLCCHWFIATGYSELGNAIYHDLISLGFNVDILPLKIWIPTFVSNRKFGELKKACSPIKKKFYEKIIIVDLPTAYERMLDVVQKLKIKCNKKIGATTLECGPWLGGWVKRCNLMDEIWVNTEFDKINAKSSGVNKEVKIVIPKNLLIPYNRNSKRRDSIFTFFFMGQLVSNDRKNIFKLLKIFSDIPFNKPVKIKIKTYIENNSLNDYNQTVNMLKEITKNRSSNLKIEVHHGYVENISKIYEDVDCFICISHGEGVCIPLLNAVNMEIPVIIPYFGGPVTYIKKEFSSIIKHSMVPLTLNVDNVYSKNQSWCDVDEIDVKRSIIEMVDNYDDYRLKAKKQKKYMLRKLSIYDINRVNLVM